MLSVLLLASCSSTPVKEGGSKAETLFFDIERSIKNGRYLLALEKIDTLRSKYPFSIHAIPAELLRAEIFVKQENYADAIDAFTTFANFHPRHKKIEYVYWMIAESNFRLIPDTVDRDLTMAKEAILAYRKLIQRFPGTDYAKKSKEKILTSIDLIEEREEYVADFYYKTKKYHAAKYRYSGIIEKTQNTKRKKKAARRVIRSFVALKSWEECISYSSDFYARGLIDEKISDNFRQKCEKKLRKAK